MSTTLKIMLSFLCSPWAESFCKEPHQLSATATQALEGDFVFENQHIPEENHLTQWLVQQGPENRISTTPHFSLMQHTLG